jgi:hypothetical protein
MKYLSYAFTTKFIFIALCLLGFVGCINVFKLSDLRSDNLLDNNEEAKARQLMTEMGIAHGIDKWKDITTYTVNFGEEFYGFIGKQGNPFKNKSTSLSLSYIPKTSNGQIEILSGRERGTIWGVQENQAYIIFDDELMTTVDEDILFWVPTYQYFIEFPNRIQEATSISYVGKDTINGAICEGVLASWNTVKPQKDIDQYLIWIDSATKRIAKLEYTIRDINKYISGSAYFINYNDYEGIILPSEFLVESNLVKKGLLHKMSIYNFTRDYMHINSLSPIQNEEED